MTPDCASINRLIYHFKHQTVFHHPTEDEWLIVYGRGFWDCDMNLNYHSITRCCDDHSTEPFQWLIAWLNKAAQSLWLVLQNAVH